jgi:hypothetical protein
VERHLTTLKAALAGVTGAGELSLRAPTGLLAEAGARTAPPAFAGFAGTRGWMQVAETHFSSIASTFKT